MKLDIAEFSTSDANFEQRIRDLLDRGFEIDPKIDAKVAEIIHAVRERGDSALLEFTQEYDRNSAATVAELEVGKEEMRQAFLKTSPTVVDALQQAYERIGQFHKLQSRAKDNWYYYDHDKSLIGQRSTPIENVGVYVPGGRASYPSSVLMTVVPAVVAGVREIVMMVPAPGGLVIDSVLVAAFIAGVDRVFKLGGAQAIAALAYGTETIPKVDKIVGPGNAWVSSAKRQVFGHVGIDLIAGPSEVVVACDDTTNAEWAAMDMFAQAEHDESAQSILLSVSQDKIDEVRTAMSIMLPKMERRDIISRSLAQHGAMICVRDRQELTEVIDQIAPEHLGLMVENSMEIFDSVLNAGSVFVGQYSSEVFGDYCAGPNHVLPTSGTARFSSPLGVYDFQRRTSYIQCSKESANELAYIASNLASEENLTAHARAADYRKSREPD